MARLLLVRHARAGARGHGPEDLDRPLDERGTAQAAALPALLVPLIAPLLDAGDAPEVLSSPARRCVDTVAPLAAAFGTMPRVDEALVEGSDARPLHARIARIERPTVWSSHGDVIPDLLLMLARRGLDLGPDARFRKGSTWVLELSAGAVVAARYLPPPDVTVSEPDVTGARRP